MSSLPASVREQVFARASYRCEYCQTAHRLIGLPLVVDHILPRTLGGGDDLENLCASCYRCNELKWMRTHGIDPTTGKMFPLFNPRTQNWQDHFVWINGGTHIAGITPEGRASVLTLQLNNELLVESRILWISWRWHPPG